MEHTVIAQSLREKSGHTLCSFAKTLNVSRQTIYESIKGKGSRRIRIQIAINIKVAPSILWEKNDYKIKIIDDVEYMRALS